MHKLNIRKRRPRSTVDPDSLVALAYESRWWSSRLVLPTLLGAGATSLCVAAAWGNGWTYAIGGTLLAVVTLVLGMRGLTTIRRFPAFEIHEGYIILGRQVLAFADVEYARFGPSPLVRPWWI